MMVNCSHGKENKNKRKKRKESFISFSFSSLFLPFFPARQIESVVVNSWASSLSCFNAMIFFREATFFSFQFLFNSFSWSLRQNYRYIFFHLFHFFLQKTWTKDESNILVFYFLPLFFLLLFHQSYSVPFKIVTSESEVLRVYSKIFSWEIQDFIEPIKVQRSKNWADWLKKQGTDQLISLS